ncbi:hypothetical protein EKO04_004659 [Ascochyta lentis]|uniref:Uncharacterized protein n=1 Tax=Ascochyta lentis TaxID=205686 RepID=A0A8H7J2P5_9PLEO|nr:hypothetical protein EKO04_004659 [Ascochyta lentis]
MPSTSRKTQNERIAREKALHTRVYVSGLEGHHTLEVGLAYYYRGHYMYACPAANLIEPIPYSTRKGIMIQGIVSASAPAYDASAPGLQPESSVEALKKSITSEREAQDHSTTTSTAATSSTFSQGGMTSSSPPLLFPSTPQSTTDDPAPPPPPSSHCAKAH